MISEARDANVVRQRSQPSAMDGGHDTGKGTRRVLRGDAIDGEYAAFAQSGLELLIPFESENLRAFAGCRECEVANDNVERGRFEGIGECVGDRYRNAGIVESCLIELSERPSSQVD